MTLIEKLEREARKLDIIARQSIYDRNGYAAWERDLCNLLEQAVKALREKNSCPN